MFKELWRYLSSKETWRYVWEKLWEPQHLCAGGVCTKKDILPLLILFLIVIVFVFVVFLGMGQLLDFISGIAGDKEKRWLVFGL